MPIQLNEENDGKLLTVHVSGKLGIPQTVESRRAYRELIVTTPGLGESISGAILYDETIRQQQKDGTRRRWKRHDR